MNFKIEKKQCCGAGLDRNRTIVDAGSNPVLLSESAEERFWKPIPESCPSPA